MNTFKKLPAPKTCTPSERVDYLAKMRHADRWAQIYRDMVAREKKKSG